LPWASIITESWAADPQYLPVGLAVRSQTNLMLTTDQMVKSVQGDVVA
jgi:hypothetical protein